MKTIKIFLAIAFALFAFSYQGFSQTYLLNGNQNISTCAGTLYDSGGASGQYGNNESYTVVLCSDNDSVIQLNFTSFNLATGDILEIYNGAGTTNLLITGTGSSLNGQSVTSLVDCLTLVWTTNPSGVAAGFAANIECSTLCQGYTSSVSTSTSSADIVGLYLDVCPGEVLDFYAITNFLNNDSQGYHQTVANTTYHWEMIDQFNQPILNQSALGLNHITYTFNQSVGYTLTLRSTDMEGCWNMGDATLRIRVSVPPTFTGTTLAPSPICPGELVTFTGHVQTYPWQMSVVDTEIVEECFLDHYNGTICFDVNTFAPGQTITSAADLASVCVNMEHSYLGDFYMYIQCPNGQETQLHAYQTCNNSYFGLPNHADNCVPGTGWDYCWSMSATQPISAVCSSGQSVPAGTYLPIGSNSFSSLIGCPVNGEWCIRFFDNWGADDGYIWTANLNFSPSIMPQDTWGYENVYNQGANSTDGAWSGPNMADAVGFVGTANPVVSGNINYTFTATDDFGCSYDTTLFVVVKPITDPTCCIMPNPNAGVDASVCATSYNLNATLTTGNTGAWVVTSGPPGATFADASDPQTTVNIYDMYGIYTFTWTEYYLGNVANTACTASDAVTITFNETFDPTIEAIEDMCLSAAPFQVIVADFGTLTCSPATAGLNATTGVFNPELAGPGVYTITNTLIGPCTGSGVDTETFEIWDEIATTDFTEVCGADGEPTYVTVSWNVIGSAGLPYSGYYVNGISQSNSSFTASIVSPATYSDTVTDTHGCSSIIINGFRNCGCPLYAGTMESLQTVILCEDQCAENPYVQHNGNQDLGSGNAIFEYMIHKGDNIPIAYRDEIDFCFQGVSGLHFDSIYYISAICGYPLGGHANIGSTCYSIAAGTPVMWRKNPIASAGINRDTCGLVIKLNANAPAEGMYGYWSSDCNFFAVGGTSHTMPNAIVMGGEYNTCTFTWNVVNGQCVDGDDVVIRFLATPNPYAGPDIVVCGNSATMAATPPTPGVNFMWSGNGTSFSPQSSATAAAQAGGFGTYQYTLNADNGSCSGSDNVLVTYIQPPSPITTPNVDTVCGTEYNLSVITGPNPDGAWAAYDYDGTNWILANPAPLYDPSDTIPLTIATIGNYVGENRALRFIWTETSEVLGTSCTSEAYKDVVFAKAPSASVGASNQREICGNCITFNASTTGIDGYEHYWIQKTYGDWVNPEGATAPNATFCLEVPAAFGDTAYVETTFLWAVKNGGCVSLDTMYVTFYQAPIANAGLDKAVCGNENDMNAVWSLPPNSGYTPSGIWSVGTHPTGESATWGNTAARNSHVTVSEVGIWEFIFRENNVRLSSCYDTDTVQIEFVEYPVISAGPDKDVCGNCTTLDGISGGFGGSWLPNGGDYVDFTNPNSEVCVAAYVPTTFTWLESNSATTQVKSCTATDDVVITFWRVPSANIMTDAADSTVCGLKFDNLRAESSGTGITGYWYNINPSTVYGDAFSNNTWAKVPTYGYHNFYWIEQTGPALTPGFCNDTAGPLRIKFIKIPTANAGGDTLFCGYTGKLNAIPSVGTGVWSTPSGQNITFANQNNAKTPVTSNIINTGHPTHPNFKLIWTENNSSCTNNDTVLVIFARVPTSEMDIIPPKCFGEPATIAASEDSLQQYSWSFNTGVVDSLTINALGGRWENFVYWNSTDTAHRVSLIATNHWGCQSPIRVDTVYEPIIPKFDIEIIMDTCALGKGGFVFHDTLGTSAFMWTDPNFGPAPGTTVDTVYNLPMGEYGIHTSYQTPNMENYAYYNQIFGTANCVDTFYYEVETIGMIDADMSVSGNILLTELVAPDAKVTFMNTSDYDNVSKRCEWHFGDGSTAKTCDELVEHIYTKAGCFEPFLVVMNRNLPECRDTARLETCIFVDDASKLEVPNIFSPNGDGINDFFQVKARTLKSFNGTITNRWGRTVFEWTDWETYESGWDGKIGGGSKASPGVYFYIITAEGLDGEPHNFKGALHLMSE